MTTDRQVTAEELLNMPSPGNRCELIKGRLVKMEPTGGRHGHLTVRIARLLDEHVELQSAGTVLAGDPGFYLERDPDTVLAPDVAFVSAARLPPGELPESFPDLAPDLAVEIMSPSDSHPAVEAKARTWIRLGARMVWIVDPRGRRITVYENYEDEATPRVLTEADLLTGDAVLPEFACPVRRVFEV